MTLAAQRVENVAADCQYRRALADLFHALNQPLTTLSCCLAVSLQKPLAVKQYQENLRVALRQAESINRLTSALRELVDAGDAGGNRKKAFLDEYLREVVSDLLPVARTARVRLCLIARKHLRIDFEPNRLRQAIFHLAQFALGSAAADSEIEFAAAPTEVGVRLSIRLSSPQSEKQQVAPAVNLKSPELGPNFDLAIARRIFQSAGGSLRMHHRQGRVSVEICLPLG